MQTRFTTEQLADREIAASEAILRRCVHCGFCTATCPTYVLLGDELDGPRGRIYLIKDMLENSRPATREVVRHLDRCLSCLACMTTCPSGVHYQHLIDHARGYVERTYRRSTGERALRALLANVLPYPGRLRAALAAAAVLRGLARWTPTLARRLARRAPAAWRAMARLAAYEAPRPNAERCAATHSSDELVSRSAPRAGAAPARAAGSQPLRGRVALLAGCAQSVLTPRTQAACTRLIERAGFEPVVIEGCCGALVHHLGRAAETRSFAAALLERVAAERRRGDLAAVIVDASGCGTHLKDLGYLFRDDPALAGAARELSELTRDITEWLEERERARPEPSSAATALRGITVAYHSACSMQHGQRLDAIPRRLLERAGFEVREIAEGHLCCGSAGTYNVLQPQIAAELRERKLANIRRTGARLVATGNVGCIVQLAGPGVTVVHTAELLDWAGGGPPPI
ncbi:MAG: heterodisulfide reductase-related iron-sulfur binding cluster [Steroidobacteraceae bacterium]